MGELIFLNKLIEGSNALAPMADYGGIYTKAQWEAIKSQVDLFYNLASSEQIKSYNERRNQQETEPSAPIDLPSPPQERKQGYIYVLKSEAGHYKIGKAKDPFARSQTIGTQHAHKIKLIYIALCHDYTTVERFLHNALAAYRMNGEWFNLPSDKVEWLLYHDWIDDAGLGRIVTSMERIPQ